MKKLWLFCRRCAAYMVRENNSLFDILVLVSMLRLIDQGRYWDAAVLLLISGVIATVLKGMTGKLNDKDVVINNTIDPRYQTEGFGRRVQETLNGKR